MKKLLPFFLILLAVLASGPISAQAPLQTSWTKIVVPSDTFHSRAWSVTSSPSGHLYWSTNQPYTGIANDQVLYKLDTAGNEIWPNPGVYDRYLVNQSYIVREKNGIVYTAGRIGQCFFDIGLICVDASLIAWNSLTGDTLWSRSYDISGEYEEVDGLVIEDSSIFFTGWTRDSDSTYFDVLLTETDLQGNVIWQKAYDEGNNRDERQDGHIYVDSSHIFCTGVSDANPTNFAPTGGFGGDATIWKFDRSGNYVDHRAWNDTPTPMTRVDDALGMASDGTYMYTVGYLSQANFNAMWFIRKYDKNLNLIWQDEWDGPDGEVGRAVTLDPAGNIYAAVNTFSHGPTEDIALLKYTPNGQLESYRLWDGGKDDHALDIHYFQDALYISGSVTSMTTNKLEPLLMKVETSTLVGTDVTNDYLPFTLHQNFPNPTLERTNIQFDLPTLADILIEVRDLQGRPMINAHEGHYDAGQHTLNLDLSHLAAGNYLYSLQVGGRKFTRMLQIVH